MTTPQRSDRALLSMDEAAAELGISVRTLFDHCRFGEITYIAVGRGLKRRRKMFDPEDLTRFRERQRRTECPSSDAPARRSSRTTSGSEVVDFRALREQRRSAKRRGPKTGRAT